MNKDTKSGSSSGPKTLIRGLTILEAIRNAGPSGLRIPEIARRTGVQRTTVYRYVDVLTDMGYVRLDPESQAYVFHDSRSLPYAADTHTLERLRQALRRISDATGDSSFLVRRDNGDSLCLHREQGSYPVQVLAVTIGHRQPMGVGAAGLALLASLAHTEVEAVLTLNAGRLPQFGGMTCAQMRRLVKSTRERGWSVVGNAAVPGVLGVGVPVWRKDQPPLYAISVSSILARMPLQRQRFVVDVIRKELQGLARGPGLY